MPSFASDHHLGSTPPPSTSGSSSSYPRSSTHPASSTSSPRPSILSAVSPPSTTASTPLLAFLTPGPDYDADQAKAALEELTEDAGWASDSSSVAAAAEAKQPQSALPLPLRSILKPSRPRPTSMSLDVSSPLIAATWASLCSSDHALSFFILGHAQRSKQDRATQVGSSRLSNSVGPGEAQPFEVVVKGSLQPGEDALEPVRMHISLTEARFVILRVADRYLLVQCLGEKLR